MPARRWIPQESWRTPHGIDSYFRRGFRGYGVQPGIGYGSNKKTRYTLKNGLKKFRVFNAGDLDMLLMHNRTYCAEIAHNVSARKRKDIVQRAQQLNVVVINANGKLRAEESE